MVVDDVFTGRIIENALSDIGLDARGPARGLMLAALDVVEQDIASDSGYLKLAIDTRIELMFEQKMTDPAFVSRALLAMSPEARQEIRVFLDRLEAAGQ